MIREEQINRVARELLEPIEDNLGYDMSEFEHDVNIFKQGVNWADNNPHWNKWPENKPTENKVYEVLLRQPFSNKEYHVFDTYNTSYKSWIGYETSRFAVAWKEVSKAPKFY